MRAIDDWVGALCRGDYRWNVYFEEVNVQEKRN
jgi:hypothetical protein